MLVHHDPNELALSRREFVKTLKPKRHRRSFEIGVVLEKLAAFDVIQIRIQPGSAWEETRDGTVFVDLRPVDSAAGTREFQALRCATVACRRRGYHAKGAENRLSKSLSGARTVRKLVPLRARHVYLCLLYVGRGGAGTGSDSTDPPT